MFIELNNNTHIHIKTLIITTKQTAKIEKKLFDKNTLFQKTQWSIGKNGAFVKYYVSLHPRKVKKMQAFNRLKVN